MKTLKRRRQELNTLRDEVLDLIPQLEALRADYQARTEGLGRDAHSRIEREIRTDVLFFRRQAADYIGDALTQCGFRAVTGTADLTAFRAERLMFRAKVNRAYYLLHRLHMALFGLIVQYETHDRDIIDRIRREEEMK